MMRSFRVRALVLGAMSVLVACGGGTPSSVNPAATHVGARRSWVARAARETRALLYVSNGGSGDVTIYDYKAGNNLTLVGTLTGFSSPQQPCVDASGDVFIPDSGAAQIVEYPHGGATPIATLSFPGGFPYSCSVDVYNSGNLAVTNNDGYAGSVGVYTGAAGLPTIYRTGLTNVFYDGYDPSGNLFVDGFTGEGSNLDAALSELPRSGSAFSKLTIAGALVDYPQQVQWSGQQLLLGDLHIQNGNSGLYRMRITGTTATVTGITQFTAFDQGGFWKTSGGHKVVAASAAYGHGSAVYVYNYPAGSLYATITDGISVPEGVVISIAP